MELITTRWDVQVFLSEQDGTTHAVARALISLGEQLMQVAEADVEALAEG